MSSGVKYSSVPAWRINEFNGIDKLKLVSSSIAPPKRHQVTVRIHAVSLNFRDLIVVKGTYTGAKDTSNGGLIPCSDGAGVVIEVGEDVTEFKVGDRVATTFHTDWERGEIAPDIGLASLGGTRQGTLTEIGVFEEKGLVHIPASLSFEEAATLPCAPVTAWSSLRSPAHQPIGPESTVLVQGTGGVSIFAAQLAIASGARVIATSSSTEKLAAYKKMGVKESDLINYKTHPDWSKKVRELVPKGVDHVVEVAGQMSESLKSVRSGGIVSCIGFVGGAQSVSVFDLLFPRAQVRGIWVGSREGFIQMNKAIEKNGIKPVIDRVFDFKQAPQAFSYLESQKHVGKIVIKLA